MPKMMGTAVLYKLPNSVLFNSTQQIFECRPGIAMTECMPSLRALTVPLCQQSPSQQMTLSSTQLSKLETKE